MPATTPHVGVRTFLNLTDVEPFIIADMSSIGGCFEPVSDMDRDFFPPNEPVAFTTDDAAAIAAAGTTGTLKQTIDAITAEGIVATLVATVPAAFVNNATIDQKMAAMVGSASGGTGLYSLLSAEAHTGVEPDLLICPGYTSQRLGGAANPAATAIDALCERIITAIGICDTPSTNRVDAVGWTADFTGTMNLVAVGQGVRVLDGTGAVVTRPASPSIAALIAKTDKAEGAPYYNPGNRALTGILGPNRTVGFSISDPDSEANYLIQRGVNSLVQINKSRTSGSGIQGKTFWGFFNTCDDPLWRAINVVRTRKAVREVIPRTLVKYVGQNLGAHVVVVMLTALETFLSELKSLPKPAILGGRVRWDRQLNSDSVLRAGGLVVNCDFEEAPPITDVQVYTGRYAPAFNILASEIQTAMDQAGVTGQLA